MNQWQLWAVIAAPAVLALTGILLNQRGLDRLDSRVDKGFEKIDRRMERFEDRMEELRKEYIGLLNMIGDHSQRIVRLEERAAIKK